MYATGHVKRDPETGTVAVRTGWPDQDPWRKQLWMSATTRSGAHFLTAGDVEDWDDLYVPPEPEPEAETGADG